MLTFIAYHADLSDEHDKLAKIFVSLDKDKSHTLSREELRIGTWNFGP